MVKHRILLLLLLSILSCYTCHAEKDANSYLWEDANQGKFKMYWNDASNVLEDLTSFQYLYIKTHGCVWSEYGLGPDVTDDGESHDGDSGWYQPRTQSFRANVAFSLYGVLKGSRGNNGCSQGTYINSFFTLYGPEILLSALGISVAEDDYYYNPGTSCVQTDQSQRQIKSNDNKNNKYYQYVTLGCSEEGNEFVVASFSDKSCNGMYFLNTTDANLDNYNTAIQKVTCSKVWDLSKHRSLGYGSTAETILSSSTACDSTVYPNCPDPYGMKRRYNSFIATSAATKLSRSYNGPSFNTTFRVLSSLLLVMGMSLMLVAYIIRNRTTIKKNGGGVNGIMSSMISNIKGDVKDNDNDDEKSATSDTSMNRTIQKKRIKQVPSDDSSVITPPFVKELAKRKASNRRFGAKMIPEKRTQSIKVVSNYVPPGLRAAPASPPRRVYAQKPLSPSRTLPAQVQGPPTEKLVDKYVASGIQTSFSSEKKSTEDIDSVTYVPPFLQRTNPDTEHGLN